MGRLPHAETGIPEIIECADARGQPFGVQRVGVIDRGVHRATMIGLVAGDEMEVELDVVPGRGRLPALVDVHHEAEQLLMRLHLLRVGGRENGSDIEERSHGRKIVE